MSRRRIFDQVLREDLLTFIGKSFSVLEGNAAFMPNWHLEVIADVLSRLHRGEIKRLIITVPPRSLKSISVSVAFPAWLLGLDPSLRIICASYAQELASKFTRDTRALMQSDFYGRAFPRTKLSSDKLSEIEFETTKRGGRYGTSVGGVLTGRGCDYLIIDDPMKPQDAYSEAMRQKTIEWFRTTAASRLNDKVNGRMIVIMQRLHCDDLVGHLLESGDGWVHLNLPAIATQEEHLELLHGRVVGRKEGELLHPSREPMEVIEELKVRLGSQAFSAQYQQEPIPLEGNLFKADWLQTVDEKVVIDGSPSRIVQSWDTALTKGPSSDYTTCTTWKVQEERCFLLDVYRARLNYPELKKRISEHKRMWNAQDVLIEDAGAGKALIQDLRNEGTHVIAISATDSKLERAQACSPMIESRRVYLPPAASWLDVFRKEILMFPNGRHDDQVDSMTQFLNWQRTRSSGIRVQIHDFGRGLVYDSERPEVAARHSDPCRQTITKPTVSKIPRDLPPPMPMPRF